MANLTRTLAILFFTLAVALGIFAFTLARSPEPHGERAAAQNTPQQLSANAHLVPVVIAARDLAAGQSLDGTALTVRMQAEAAPGSFNDIAQLAGRVTRTDVAQGTPLTEDALSSGLADVVLPGERAIAVQVDETNAVGNYVRPGNFVDVFFMLKREGGATGTDAEIPATQARLLLSKVRVLSIGGAAVGGTATGANGGSATASGGAISRNSGSVGGGGGRTAVLAVRTADVDAITLAEGSGRLVLALRNPGDDEAVPAQPFAPLVQVSAPGGASDAGAARAAAGVSLSALAGGHGVRERAPVRSAAPAPVAAPRAAPRGDDIEVIRGGRVERTAS